MTENFKLTKDTLIKFIENLKSKGLSPLECVSIIMEHYNLEIPESNKPSEKSGDVSGILKDLLDKYNQLEENKCPYSRYPLKPKDFVYPMSPNDPSRPFRKFWY
jgi:hypothetical protein